MRERAGSTMTRLRHALDRSLFKAPPTDALRLHGWEGALAAVAFIALLMVLHLLRTEPTDTLNSLWAEDGAVFFHGALSESFLDAITSSYAGYLVVVPRLISEVATITPLEDAPVVINLVSILLVALSGLAVWVGSAGHIRSPFLRGLLAALTVLSPVASLEAVVSGAYVPWYMLFASFWLLLWRPATTLSAATGALFIFATGLSSPGMAFFLPLALLRAVAIRDRRDLLIVGAFALALAIQLPVTLLSDEDPIDPLWSSMIVTSFLQRVVDGAVLGENLGGDAWKQWGWPFLIALTTALIGLFALALRKASSNRLAAVIAAGTSILMFFGSSYQRAAGEALHWPEAISHGLGGRYAIVPSLLLISAALLLLDPPERGPRPRAQQWPAFVVAAVLLLSLVTSFNVGNSEIRTMPSWTQSLRKAGAACETKAIADAPIFVAPPGMAMYVPCERLESRYGATLAP